MPVLLTFLESSERFVTIGGSRLALRGFVISILWRRFRHQIVEQMAHCNRDLFDSSIKDGLGRRRGAIHASDLPHELQRGIMALGISRGRLKVVERHDVSAHIVTVRPSDREGYGIGAASEPRNACLGTATCPQSTAIRWLALRALLVPSRQQRTGYS